MPNETERIQMLENEIMTLKVDVAVAKSDIATVKGKLDKIDTNISKLTWIVVAAVLGAILKSVGIL